MVSTEPPTSAAAPVDRRRPNVAVRVLGTATLRERRTVPITVEVRAVDRAKDARTVRRDVRLR